MRHSIVHLPICPDHHPEADVPTSFASMAPFLKKKLLAILLPLLMLSGSLNAQKDSLLAVFQQETNDSLKWLTLFRISQDYSKYNLDSALIWAETGLRFARDHAPYLEPRSLNNVGLQYMNKGNFDRAMDFFLQALESAHTYNCAACIATTTGNMGVVAWNKKEYDKAENYLREAISMAKSIRDTAGQVRYLNNLGLVKSDQAKLDEAEKYYQEALNLLANKKNLPIHPTILNNLANIVYARGDFNKALEYYRQLTEEALFLHDESARFLGVNNTGWAHYSLKNYEAAIESFKASMAIARDMKNDKYLEQATGALADAYKAKGDFQNAFTSLESYLMIHDTIASRQSSRVVSELETRYQTQQKEAAIKQLESDNRLKNLLNYGALIGILALLVVLWLSRRTYRQRRLLQQATIDRLESERKVVALNAHLEGQQRERLRIAEDLHDDFGSGLSKISLLSELVKKKAPAPELDKISSAAKELLLKMSEIVWALNFRNDTLPSLAAYIRRYASGYFEDTDVRCIFNIPDELPQAPLAGEVRRNVFLVVKESLHNILKHAEATRVEIAFAITGSQLEIRISDNGKGFSPSNISAAGNGLANMARRMETENGTYSIESAPGGGTITHLALPLNIHEASAAAQAA